MPLAAYLVLLTTQTYLVLLTAQAYLVLLTAHAYLVLLTALASLAQVVALVLGYCHSVPCSGTCGSLGWPWCRSPWSIWGSATQRRHPRLLAAPWLSSSRPVCSHHLQPRPLALVPCNCAGAWPAPWIHCRS